MKINHLNLEYDKLQSFRKLETFFKKKGMYYSHK